MNNIYYLYVRDWKADTEYMEVLELTPRQLESLKKGLSMSDMTVSFLIKKVGYDKSVYIGRLFEPKTSDWDAEQKLISFIRYYKDVEPESIN